MDFTVSDFLALSELKGTRIVAGKRGLQNVITRTNIMDNPDTFDWLMPGEFLLSTGYIFKESPAVQRQIIRSLAEINCAGLCIKIKRYLPEIPLCMIEEANRLSLPLVELPFGYSLSTVIGIINRKLFYQTDQQMEQTLLIHREITHTALASGGLSGIAETLVRLIGNPVLFADSSWNLLSWKDCPNSPISLADCINLKKRARIFPREFTDTLPDNLGYYKKAVTRVYGPDPEHTCTCRILPIAAHGYIYGYIVVPETVHKLTDLDYVALEQAAVVAALERIRAKEVEQIKLRVRKDFFDDLLSGNIESLNAVRSMAELHGLNPEKRYRCLLVRYREDGQTFREESLMNQNRLRQETEFCISAASQAAEAHNLKVTIIPRSIQLAILIELGTDTQEDERAIRAMAQKIVSLLRERDDSEPILAVVGKEVPELSEIHKSFQTAQRGVRMARAMNLSNQVIYMDDFAVYQLLSENIERDALRRFCENSIGSLIHFDEENGTQLLSTLGKYFQHNGNISDAAKDMYIHRNTYIYRMEKIKTLLDTDLKNAQKLLELQLAILIHQFLL